MDSHRWHDWCTSAVPVEPSPLTLKRWNALDGGARRSHIEQLKRWLHHYYFETGQFDHVAERLNTIMERNTETPPGAKEIPVIRAPIRSARAPSSRTGHVSVIYSGWRWRTSARAVVRGGYRHPTSNVTSAPWCSSTCKKGHERRRSRRKSWGSTACPATEQHMRRLVVR